MKSRELVHEYLKQYIKKYGFAPSVREIGESVGLAISTVHRHLENLERDGVIRRKKNSPRAMALVDEG